MRDTKHFAQESLTLSARWVKHLWRRPVTVVLSLAQPLMWYLLWQSSHGNEHGKLRLFIWAGFAHGIHSALPLIFDREFGFWDRIWVAPLISRSSIMISLLLVNWLLVVIPSLWIEYQIWPLMMLLVWIATSLSVFLALWLPSHTSFLASVWLINAIMILASWN
uniref:ORF171 n=1 Tax=Cyanidiococcus yangmingshanensis TaxID=2690220 RepID=A0A7G5VUP3_9RHOD|nr:ORF171 [Cyanidiococcus yangmingshanensis]QMX77410.1 ORF171 [Cyanidiococcus yangmingshanensis]UNJ16025.1 ABC-2 type transporter [Cyanidioschyzonaceae sp. 3]WDB00484.1 ORF163 [Cyanidiococcus yangmingshanensis]